MVAQEFSKHDPTIFYILCRTIFGSLSVNVGIKNAVIHVLFALKVRAF